MKEKFKEICKEHDIELNDRVESALHSVYGLGYNDGIDDVENPDFSKMSQNEIYENLNEIAINCEGTVYQGYSGRGMYGKKCWGIDGNDLVRIIEQAAIMGLTGASFDNMGRGYIVYWTRLKYNRDELYEDEDEDEDEDL